MKTFRETALLLSAALFLTACGKEAVQETGPSGSVSGRKVEMTFGLSASGMTSPAAFIPVTAKAAGADEALVLETGAQEPLTRGASLSGDEEGKLHGLWVLQFDNTTSAGKLVLREYHAAGEIQNDKLSVALYDAAATKVYFVANVADDKFSSLPLNTTTLGASRPPCSTSPTRLRQAAAATACPWRESTKAPLRPLRRISPFAAWSPRYRSPARSIWL